MTLSRRVARVGVALDQLPLPASAGEPLPDVLIGPALDLKATHEAVVHAREHASLDSLKAGTHDRLRYDAFLSAHRFGVELYRWQGRDVSQRERRLEQWLEERDLEDAASFEERIRATAVPEPELQIPEAIQREVQQAFDSRRAMRKALGTPSREHREWAEQLRSDSSTT